MVLQVALTILATLNRLYFEALEAFQVVQKSSRSSKVTLGIAALYKWFVRFVLKQHCISLCYFETVKLNTAPLVYKTKVLCELSIFSVNLTFHCKNHHTNLKNHPTTEKTPYQPRKPSYHFKNTNRRSLLGVNVLEGL